MTVEFDTDTRFPATEATSDTTTGDRSFTHTPTGTPAGVVVVICANTNANTVTGVTYGGVAMTLSINVLDATEAGSVYIYTLGTGVPSGAQTVVLQGCTATAKFCTCSTVTAATSNTVVHDSSTASSAAGVNPTLPMTITLPCMSFAGIHSGFDNLFSTINVAGNTEQNNNDYGTTTARTQRRTNVDFGSFTFDYIAGSDDYAYAGVSICEDVGSQIFLSAMMA